MVFGLWGQEDIRAAVEATGRDCFVLAGLETDVCVAQSALGLRAAGYQVAVVADACASPPPHHENGLRRLQGSGVVLTAVKTVFYEWLRDLETNLPDQGSTRRAEPCRTRSVSGVIARSGRISALTIPRPLQTAPHPAPARGRCRNPPALMQSTPVSGTGSPPRAPARWCVASGARSG